MILVCKIYQHFIYHLTWASLNSKTYWLIKKHIWLFWQFPNPRVQPGSHCGRSMWNFYSLKTCGKGLASHTKNVGKSQNNMNPLFLYFELINNALLIVPPAVLVIIDGPSNFQDFLKLKKMDACNSQNMCAYP